MANKLVIFILISVYYFNRTNCADKLDKLNEILSEVRQLAVNVRDLLGNRTSIQTEGFYGSDLALLEIQSVINRYSNQTKPLCNNNNQEEQEPLAANGRSRTRKFKTAAVSSDAAECSTIGRRALLGGGNAVDSALAVLFCLGVVQPQSGGLGGGFHMTIADTKHKAVICLDARETAPKASTETMFQNSSAQSGGLSVAVPGELAGYWAAHQAFGQLPWAKLILPSALLAEKGVRINRPLAESLKSLLAGKFIKEEASLKMFVDETTGELKKEGDVYKLEGLGKTLRIIAEEGAQAFYNGTIGRKFVQDVQSRGGILTEEDLLQYRALWVNPVKVDLKNNLTLFSSPAPGSGILLASIMKILDGLELDRDDPVSYHRIAEAFKHAYAQRTKLGDPQFVPEVKELMKVLLSDEWIEETRSLIKDSYTSNDPEMYGAVTYQPNDHGTAHVSVVDHDGMAVSATTTINLYFGAKFMSEQTGIIPNDEMDDFSTPGLTNFFGIPPSPANFIRPGKRPLSSMAPTIVIHTSTEQVRLAVGAIGGSQITSAVAYTLIRHLRFNESISDAIDSPRLHHQLFPMILGHQKGFQSEVLESLKSRGHVLKQYGRGASVFGISVDSSGLWMEASADPTRKGGDVDGLDPL